MPISDSFAKLLEAANKFLFAASIVSGILWRLGPDEFMGVTSVRSISGLVSLFCFLALAWDLSEKGWRFYVSVRQTNIERVNQERTAVEQRTIQERAIEETRQRESAERKHILARIALCHTNERATLGYLVLNQQREIFAPSDNPILQTLYDRAILTSATGTFPPSEWCYRVPDFVWDHINAPSNRDALTSIRPNYDPPWNMPRPINPISPLHLA